MKFFCNLIRNNLSGLHFQLLHRINNKKPFELREFKSDEFLSYTVNENPVLIRFKANLLPRFPNPINP